MGCRKLAEFEPDIWLPGRDVPRAGFARGIGGRSSGRRMLNSPVLPSAGFTGNFATLFPGAYQVAQSDLGLTYGGTMRATGATPPVITLTGALSGVPVPIEVDCTAGGALGAWTGSVSYDGGSTVAQVFTSAATIALVGAGTGLTLNIAAGNAAVDDVWKATASALGDQSGNGSNYSQATASKQPIIGVGLNGKVSLIHSGSSLVSLLNLPAPATTAYYTAAVFRQLSWGANLTMWGRTSGLGETVFQTTSTPTLSSYSGTAVANGGAPIGTWVDAELKRSNNAADTHKFGTTTVTASSGNNATTGMEIGSATGTNFGNIELLLLVHTPNLPDWVAFRSAVNSAAGYGVGTVLL